MVGIIGRSLPRVTIKAPTLCFFDRCMSALGTQRSSAAAEQITREVVQRVRRPADLRVRSSADQGGPTGEERSAVEGGGGGLSSLPHQSASTRRNQVRAAAAARSTRRDQGSRPEGGETSRQAQPRCAAPEPGPATPASPCQRRRPENFSRLRNRPITSGQRTSAAGTSVIYPLRLLSARPTGAFVPIAEVDTL